MSIIQNQYLGNLAENYWYETKFFVKIGLLDEIGSLTTPDYI